MRLMGLAALLAAAACRPEWDDRPWLVDRPRVIAVRAEPAEASPGAPVTLQAFVATPTGPAEEAPVEWSFCRDPKPLAENNVVAPACVSQPLSPAGPPALTITTNVPPDACRLFGPETPPQTGATPPLRPRDPDATGGHYQPVRVRLGAETSFALVRLLCNLGGAPLNVAQEYRRRYLPNRNPAQPVLIAAGNQIQTTGLDEPERFLLLDPSTQALVETAETYRMSWFTTSADLRIPTRDAIIAPLSAAHVWVVVRDTRGGVSVAYLREAHAQVGGAPHRGEHRAQSPQDRQTDGPSISPSNAPRPADP